MAARAKTAPPTTAQLELALRQLWRPGYPRTLDEALAHPTFGHCVRGLARNLGRASAPATRPHRLPIAPPHRYAARASAAAGAGLEPPMML